MPQNMSFGSNRVNQVLVRPVLHRLLCSNETVQNAPKHEFWIEWSGSGAFVAKNAYTASISELGR
jgi:hypothetical protein